MHWVALNSWVEEAVRAAIESPCLSKRGAVISSADGRLIGRGFNHQPYPFLCDGSESCRSNCGKTAVHAEQSAILNARESLCKSWMLHVKIKDGRPCFSGAPSCLECSKLILASGIEWMHLLHDPVATVLPGATIEGLIEGFRADGTIGELQVRRYSSTFFHYVTAEYHHKIQLALPSQRYPSAMEV